MKKMRAVKGFVGYKTLRYLLRHPLRGPRNLLALRGAKSLITSRGAAVTAAVTTAAVAVPLALRAVKNSSGA